MQIEKLFVEDDKGVRPVGQFPKLILGFEIDVIGRVDGLCDAIYLMCRERTTAMLRFIFNVIDPAKRGLVFLRSLGYGTPMIEIVQSSLTIMNCCVALQRHYQ